MTDVSHELGALRFVVDSPLSSKVAMFNNQATQHKQSQLLNPFSHDGRAPSPKPTFSKDQYGKPLAGSLTEARGQKANMHVMKEMLELCQIIDSEGYKVKDEPTMRVIPFGELFNIYNYISDKVVGILLRARKHKLLDFEGEMLYQRRDDDVPIFLLRPIKDIRHELNDKIEEIKRGASPAPQSTSVMLDKAAHEQKLKVHAQRQSKSRTPSPAVKTNSKSPSPAVEIAAEKPVEAAVTVTATTEPAAAVTVTATPEPVTAVTEATKVPELPTVEITPVPAATTEQVQPALESQPECTYNGIADIAAEVAVTAVAPEDNVSIVQVQSTDEVPTIVIEASATFVRQVSVEKLQTEKETEETKKETETAAAESA
ncbi:uncharacterized protein LOC117793241 [Drosophila innubila]|uniref:uncharacterized protein LOC117793241 n=1 Tax=Drosophila innubila TaxID=198719 RepID=UPI00148E48DF|nr:uncharacterized protein LOC117793241 [Drosophila innubila]